MIAAFLLGPRNENLAGLNAHRLNEYLDVAELLIALRMMEKTNLIVPANAATFKRHCDLKEAKIKKYLDYSKGLGIVT